MRCDLIFIASLSHGFVPAPYRVSAVVPNPVLKAESFAIPVRS
jgi:hypothetical protein